MDRGGIYYDPVTRQCHELFEGEGFSLLRGLFGAMRSVQANDYIMIQRLIKT